MRIFTLFIFFSAFYQGLQAQGIPLFENRRGRLFTFEDGLTVQLEGIRVDTFRSGHFYGSYVESGGELMLYRDGKKIATGYPRPDSVFNARNYSAIYTEDFLHVWTAYNNHLLGKMVDSVVFEDSLIAFNDHLGWLAFFYRDRVFGSEDEFPKKYNSGSNCFCWVNNYNELKRFEAGKFRVLSDREAKKLWCGVDYTAWVDPYDQFYVESRDNRLKLDIYPPKKVKSGDNLFSWIDVQGELKVFQEGKVQVVLEGEPINWQVEDELLVYQDFGGKVYRFTGDKNVYLGDYWPYSLEFYGDILLWLDEDRRINALNGKGEIKRIDRQVLNWELVGELIMYEWLEFNYEFRYLGNLFSR